MVPLIALFVIAFAARKYWTRKARTGPKRDAAAAAAKKARKSVKKKKSEEANSDEEEFHDVLDEDTPPCCCDCWEHGLLWGLWTLVKRLFLYGAYCACASSVFILLSVAVVFILKKKGLVTIPSATHRGAAATQSLFSQEDEAIFAQIAADAEL